MDGSHHIHIRKRAHSKIKTYPHKDKWVRFLDKFLVVIAVVGPLIALPQILQIYISGDASGVSSLSWGFFALFNLPWILYGIVHRDKPIKIAYSLSFIANSTVFVGSILY